MISIIKFCGITNKNDLIHAIQCKATHIGFVLEPSSPRCITPQLTSKLIRFLPPTVSSVAVYKEINQDTLAHHSSYFTPHFIQADAVHFSTLTLPPLVQALKVYRNCDPHHNPCPPNGAPYLFEGMHSGAGELCDLILASKSAKQGKLILAGGLNPNNMTEMIQKVRPYGIDVSSGIESSPGVKSLEKMKELIKAVNAAI